MLEHLGAYTIDADALTHRAYAKGAPGYQQVIDKFGKWLVGMNGEIDRQKLGNLVFSDAEAMQGLESIVHPLVREATELLVKRADQQVIVIEAIKLLEGELRKACDTIWVTNAPQDVQIERLVRKRKMTHEQAAERIHAQSAQSAKVSMANMVITNTGSYDELWKQVSDAWKKAVPFASPALSDTILIRKDPSGELSVKRGRPKHSKTIAELITRLSKGQRKMNAADVMADFGDKAYMMLEQGGQFVGLAGWQVENLVACTSDIFIEENTDRKKALETLIHEVEKAAMELQSEASLVFAVNDLAKEDAVWKQLGYERRTPAALSVQAWQDAAAEFGQKESTLFFKQLRQDRVLRPI